MKARTARARQQFHEDEAGVSAVGEIAAGGILLVIALVLVLTVLPVLGSSVQTYQDDENTSEGESALAGLLPLVVIAGVVVAGVAFLVRGVRDL